MKKTFTKEYILHNKGCYSIEEVNSLSFIDKKEITLKDMLTSEMPLKDRFWWLCKKCNLTKDENLSLAIKCAKTVLYIYEDKYPDDDRPRKAIVAAENYLTTHTSAAYIVAATAAYIVAADDYAAAYAAAHAAVTNAVNAVYATAANATNAATAAANAVYATAANATNAADNNATKELEQILLSHL